jgi:hypothetical protein
MTHQTPIFTLGFSQRIRGKLLEGGLFYAEEILCLTPEELSSGSVDADYMIINIILRWLCHVQLF